MGMTQEFLSYLIDVTPAHMSNIETGKTAEIVHAGGRKRRGNNRSDGGNYTGSNCLCNGIYICM